MGGQQIKKSAANQQPNGYRLFPKREIFGGAHDGAHWRNLVGRGTWRAHWKKLVSGGTYGGAYSVLAHLAFLHLRRSWYVWVRNTEQCLYSLH